MNSTKCNKDTDGKKQLQRWTRGHFFVVRGGGHIDTLLTAKKLIDMDGVKRAEVADDFHFDSCMYRPLNYTQKNRQEITRCGLIGKFHITSAMTEDEKQN
jgi:hypothetical protein